MNARFYQSSVGAICIQSNEGEVSLTLSQVSRLHIDCTQLKGWNEITFKEFYKKDYTIENLSEARLSFRHIDVPVFQK